MSDDRDRDIVRRWPIAAVLAVLLVAAIVAGNGHDRAVSAPQRETSDDPAAMAPATSRSSAWYCPGPPPSTLLGSARERVIASNVGHAPADVAVTVVPPKGKVQRHLTVVPAEGQASLQPQGALAQTSALVVEPFAAGVAVEAMSTGPNVLASAPCATQPSSQWHFAAGTTVRGVEDWIVMFNPFGDDAVVDMSFFTRSGFERPEALQGLTVPRRSRVAVQVDAQVRREPTVAASISARTGRIVAQQTLVFGPDSGQSGVTRSLGAVRPASDWVFPSGVTVPGSTRRISISNPGDLDGEVDVSVAPADDVVIEPATISVPRRGVANVQVGNCGNQQPPACIPVPANIGYSVVVRTTIDVPVVVEDLTTWTRGRYTGATAQTGSHAPARRWVFARSRVSDEIGAGLDLLATGNGQAKANISLVVGGRTISPSRLQGVVLRPGVRVTIPLITMKELKDVDAAIVVTADKPIVAERTLVRTDDVTRDLGIPAR